MCDDNHKGLVLYTEFNRRQFTALAAAAAATGLSGIARAQGGVTERIVQIKTPDGTADAGLFMPAKKSAPGVLVWPDINGLRPATSDIGRRLAGMGYVALVVNPFYRSGDAAAVAPRGTSGQDQGDRDRKTAMRALMTDEAVTRDGVAFITYLDALPETSKAKIGVQGYCMGGPLSFRTAAAMPDRVGAVGSFHGGGLVTKTPNSPHLLIEKSRAHYLVAIAKGDDANDPTAKTVLRETFDAAHKDATVEVYGANHGWCVPDSSAYDRPEAERAWTALTGLYKAALV